MIRKFAFDFYMSIPIWMSNIEEVVKIFFRWDDALPEDLVRAAYDEACEHKVHRVDAQVEEESGATNLCYEMRHGGDTCDRESEDFQARSERFYDRLQSRRQELTQATPEQSVDDEAVYLNVAGECSKGRVYGLGSVGRKKRRYGTPGASTSQTPDVVPRASSMSLRSNYERRGGYSGGGELGGGYGGFGAGGLGAYREEIVLKVYMHCEGCARKVKRCLKGFQGVEDVETDCKAHKVIVKGKQADPLKVLERVQKKSHRQVELLSPIPKPPSPEEEKKARGRKPKPEEKKEEVDKAVELRNELASRNPKNGARRVVVETHVFLFNGKASQCEPIGDKSFIIVSM
ncbi:hypothetical protein Sjap_020591 [Stephania japonica]|uniref:HMA domain-containing protein n=1 Tax=Stephania japonica TaxID=461633 RepID=A0AAP0F6I1_9MAGN